MSLWNFLGGFAVFNLVCDMFSSMRQPQAPEPEPYYRKRNFDSYPEHTSYTTHDDEIDDLQARIDELEDMQDECDITSDLYDDIQDEIDDLQDRLDELEDQDDW